MSSYRPLSLILLLTGCSSLLLVDNDDPSLPGVDPDTATPAEIPVDTGAFDLPSCDAVTHELALDAARPGTLNWAVAPELGTPERVDLRLSMIGGLLVMELPDVALDTAAGSFPRFPLRVPGNPFHEQYPDVAVTLTAHRGALSCADTVVVTMPWLDLGVSDDAPIPNTFEHLEPDALDALLSGADLPLVNLLLSLPGAPSALTLTLEPITGTPLHVAEFNEEMIREVLPDAPPPSGVDPLSISYLSDGTVVFPMETHGVAGIPNVLGLGLDGTLRDLGKPSLLLHHSALPVESTTQPGNIDALIALGYPLRNDEALPRSGRVFSVPFNPVATPEVLLRTEEVVPDAGDLYFNHLAPLSISTPERLLLGGTSPTYPDPRYQRAVPFVYLLDPQTDQLTLMVNPADVDRVSDARGPVIPLPPRERFADTALHFVHSIDAAVHSIDGEAQLLAAIYDLNIIGPEASDEPGIDPEMPPTTVTFYTFEDEDGAPTTALSSARGASLLCEMPLELGSRSTRWGHPRQRGNAALWPLGEDALIGWALDREGGAIYTFTMRDGACQLNSVHYDHTYPSAFERQGTIASKWLTLIPPAHLTGHPGTTLQFHGEEGDIADMLKLRY